MKQLSFSRIPKLGECRRQLHNHAVEIPVEQQQSKMRNSVEICSAIERERTSLKSSSPWLRHSSHCDYSKKHAHTESLNWSVKPPKHHGRASPVDCDVSFP